MNNQDDQTIKIAAWNVNSIRARLPHVATWIKTAAPNVLLLQETKATDDKFPFEDFADLGYKVAHFGQPAYNGVAIVSNIPFDEVACGMPARGDDPQARVLAATLQTATGAVRVVSVYVPNGQNLESDKYQYKLAWLEDFAAYLTEARARFGRVLAGGDYNIAPQDEDIYDAEAWGEEVLASPAERRALGKIFAAGYCDAHRLFPQPPQSFSWWDYRAAAFRRNMGIRIDLLLLSEELRGHCLSCVPDPNPRGWERASDHAPVVAEFKL